METSQIFQNLLKIKQALLKVDDNIDLAAVHAHNHLESAVAEITNTVKALKEYEDGFIGFEGPIPYGQGQMGKPIDME